MKSEGRKALEKAIMDKIQSVFDNADHITEFEIEVQGSVDEVTTIEYKVSEMIVPKATRTSAEDVGCPFLGK